jgi:CRISPR-associated protein Cas2
MRHVYIVSYDISEPARWRKVYKAVKGFGERLQYSVFRCELLAEDKVRLVAKVDALIHHEHDKLMVVDLGPSDGRGKDAIESYGSPLCIADRVPVVV